MSADKLKPIFKAALPVLAAPVLGAMPASAGALSRLSSLSRSRYRQAPAVYAELATRTEQETAPVYPFFPFSSAVRGGRNRT